MFKAIHSFAASLGVIGILAYIGLLIAGALGYVLNIVSLVQMLLVPGPLQFTGLMFGRVLGLFFFPIGGILGYF